MPPLNVAASSDWLAMCRGRRRDYVPALGIGALTPCFDALVAWAGFGIRQREEVARLLAPRAGETVLDLGCGTGTQLSSLLRRLPSVRAVGVDVDPTILRIARRSR